MRGSWKFLRLKEVLGSRPSFTLNCYRVRCEVREFSVLVSNRIEVDDLGHMSRQTDTYLSDVKAIFHHSQLIAQRTILSLVPFVRHFLEAKPMNEFCALEVSHNLFYYLRVKNI